MKQRHAKQEWETEIINFLAGELDFDVKYLQPYQIRMTHPTNGKKLDYYPQRGRASWIDGNNKWFTIEDIEKWLLENFK